MTGAPQTLLDRIRLGEDTFFELKEVRFKGRHVSAPHRASLADELAAFANTRGGVLVLGVEDRTREVTGIPLEHLDLVETWVRDLCTDLVEPPLLPIIERVLLPAAGGTEVAVISVRLDRSLFVHRSPGGYQHRVGSARREMAPDMLARLFQQRSQARIIRFDEQVVPGATLEDLTEGLWRRFETPRTRSDREDLLHKLGMARMDDDGLWRPTVAGCLLASEEPRRFLPSAYIQAVAYAGTTMTPGPPGVPYQLDAQDCTGSIDSQVTDALRFVARNMRVRAIKDIGRVDLPQFDLTAVFEALVNAVAHRDYAIHGSRIRLRVFSDRLELLVPGALPNTMTVDSLPLRQSARNEVLTSLLARCPVPATLSGLDTERRTLMDRRGEGVGVILERSERLSGVRPTYQVIDEVELVLTIWAAALDPAA